MWSPINLWVVLWSSRVAVTGLWKVGNLYNCIALVYYGIGGPRNAQSYKCHHISSSHYGETSRDLARGKKFWMGQGLQYSRLNKLRFRFMIADTSKKKHILTFKYLFIAYLMKTEWLYKCQEGAIESSGQRHRNYFSSKSLQEKILVEFSFFCALPKNSKGRVSSSAHVQ